MRAALPAAVEMTHAEIDRFIRKPPTSCAEAALVALAIERVNRATRAHSRAARARIWPPGKKIKKATTTSMSTAVRFSTLD
jgi:hypothetical protein